MNDLNLVTFFKSSFQLRAQQDNVDILWEIVMVIKKWACEKYNRNGCILIPDYIGLWTKFKRGNSLYSMDDGKLYYSQSIAFQSKNDQNVYWACKITESPIPRQGYAQRSWFTEIVYRELQGEIHFDFVVKYGDRAGFIGHYEPIPEMTTPLIIKYILRHNKIACYSGCARLYSDPIKLKIGDGEMFHELVYNPERNVPIIYISPEKIINLCPQEGRVIVSPYDINKCVLGNASVYYSTLNEFSDELEYCMGKYMTCKNGDIRVYFPIKNKSDVEAEAQRHRLLFAKTIKEWGEKEVLQIFRKAFTQNSAFYQKVYDYYTCLLIRGREEHQGQMDDKEVAIKQLEEKINDIKNLTADERNRLKESLEQLDKEKKDLKEEKSLYFSEWEKAQAELEECKDELYRVSKQNDALQNKNIDSNALNNKEQFVNSFAKLPESCNEVVQKIAALFPQRIFFSEKAMKSLEDCITDHTLLWKLLFGMVTIFYDDLQSNPANAAKEFAEQIGFEYARNAGMQTRKDNKLMRNYQDTFNGVSVNIEQHFKKGNDDSSKHNLRVYFADVGDAHPLLFIGHIGKHIPNYSSRKIH